MLDLWNTGVWLLPRSCGDAGLSSPGSEAWDYSCAPRSLLTVNRNGPRAWPSKTTFSPVSVPLAQLMSNEMSQIRAQLAPSAGCKHPAAAI